MSIIILAWVASKLFSWNLCRPKAMNTICHMVEIISVCGENAISIVKINKRCPGIKLIYFADENSSSITKFKKILS